MLGRYGGEQYQGQGWQARLWLQVEQSLGHCWGQFFICVHLYFRNNCEMTHFFFSLIREPDDVGKRMSLNLFFDTHIITQVTKPVLFTIRMYSLYRSPLMSSTHSLTRSPRSEAPSASSAASLWSQSSSYSTTSCSSLRGSFSGGKKTQKSWTLISIQIQSSLCPKKVEICRNIAAWRV